MTPEQTGCCSHLKVIYATATTDGMTRGWWECLDCHCKFVPKNYAEAREQEAAKEIWDVIDELVPFSSHHPTCIARQWETCHKCDCGFSVAREKVMMLRVRPIPTHALDIAPLEARKEEAKWWCEDAHQSLREFTMAIHKPENCTYCKRLADLQHQIDEVNKR